MHQRYIFAALIYTFTFTLVNKNVAAQYTFNNGKSSLEIGGLVSSYYNYRVYKTPNNTDFKKNHFVLNTARLKIEGRVSNKYEYEFQLDFSRLGTSDVLGEFPTMLDANFTYKKLPVDIVVGYQKLPFSRSSMVSFGHQPGWQRPEIARGYLYSRRDIGITLQKTLWQDRVGLYGGIYTGQGEYILTSANGGDGDASGKPEYVGRAEFSYPCKYRYSEVYDTRQVRKPMFSIGANGRYVTRTTNPKIGIADFDLTLAGGKRSIVGLDVAAQWRGFSGLFEIVQMTLKNPTNKALLNNKLTDRVVAGGMTAQLAYYSKKIKSGFLLRYDELTPSDLVATDYKIKNLSFCYNYMLDGFRSMLRFQYIYRMIKDDNTRLEQKYHDDLVRLGWQLAF
jgi:hypothetical protein